MEQRSYVKFEKRGFFIVISLIILAIVLGDYFIIQGIKRECRPNLYIPLNEVLKNGTLINQCLKIMGVEKISVVTEKELAEKARIYLRIPNSSPKTEQ